MLCLYYGYRSEAFGVDWRALCFFLKSGAKPPLTCGASWRHNGKTMHVSCGGRLFDIRGRVLRGTTPPPRIAHDRSRKEELGVAHAHKDAAVAFLKPREEVVIIVE